MLSIEQWLNRGHLGWFSKHTVNYTCITRIRIQKLSFKKSFTQLRKCFFHNMSRDFKRKNNLYSSFSLRRGIDAPLQILWKTELMHTITSCSARARRNVWFQFTDRLGYLMTPDLTFYTFLLAKIKKSFPDMIYTISETILVHKKYYLLLSIKRCSH